MNKIVFRLGTRKSLLAIAQSSWVARELERLNPGIQIELIGIETKGDIVLDKPLSEIEGKEFFTAEIDQALLRGEVDLTVHSMKDLSLDRPPQIKLAATPKRELAHDIIIFHESVVSRLKMGLPIRIGTSSPRRLTLVPEFLKIGLPRIQNSSEPLLNFISVRGNVNTRLGRIHESDDSKFKLDAVVLAFAGLERLAMDDKASLELKRLLQGTRKMVLPLRQCPSAPAQGALAIEARADCTETVAMIKKLHDQDTLNAVTQERKVLEAWGGGCHQKLGASLLADQTLIIRGVKPDGEWIHEVRGPSFNLSAFVKVGANDFFDFLATPLDSESIAALNHAQFIFIAHPRAYEYLSDPSALLAESTKKHVWVSGMKSWTALAKNGIWVEGSLEGTGFKKLEEFRTKLLLDLHSPFLFITHQEAQAHMSHAISSYAHRFREIPNQIKNAKALFWSSGLLFRTAWTQLGQKWMLSKKHASGPGKTAQVLNEILTPHGVTFDVFNFES